MGDDYNTNIGLDNRAKNCQDMPVCSAYPEKVIFVHHLCVAEKN